MGWIAWIILGGVAGWIASMITRNNARLGLIGNILIGIIGAFAGNFLINALNGGGIAVFGFNFTTFIIAIGGAVVLLLLFNWLRRRF
jgi:uncharacterized membrane protein YeaQ/YmgE (transglycosylase-associated protein family)